MICQGRHFLRRQQRVAPKAAVHWIFSGIENPAKIFDCIGAAFIPGKDGFQEAFLKIGLLHAVILKT
jgi:hypothetical protein